MSLEHSPSREPKRRFADRWGVCTKTIDRWVDAGLLDPPEIINGRHYFRTDAKPRRTDRDPTRPHEPCPSKARMAEQGAVHSNANSALSLPAADGDYPTRKRPLRGRR
jgi:hypothetical protein